MLNSCKIPFPIQKTLAKSNLNILCVKCIKSVLRNQCIFFIGYKSIRFMSCAFFSFEAQLLLFAQGSITLGEIGDIIPGELTFSYRYSEILTVESVEHILGNHSSVIICCE